MKQSKKHKQKFQEDVAYEADSNGHATPVPTVPFDELTVQLALLGVERHEFDEADTPQKLRELLLAKGVRSEEIQEFLADLQSGKASPVCDSPPVASLATKPSDAAHADTSGRGSRWTLTEAMANARRRILNYLPHDANNPSWGALALMKLSTAKNRPSSSLAEDVVGYIRINPRSLLKPHIGKWLVAALVDLLEAAHFSTCENRFPGLLPTDNRKRAASTARKALSLLASGSQGNPPDYPAQLLASAVGFIQVAFAPMKQAWAVSGSVKLIRDEFGDDVKGFTDKELRSLLSDELLVAAARLAERATGLSAESFETAWRKAPSVQSVFQIYLL